MKTNPLTSFGRLALLSLSALAPVAFAQLSVTPNSSGSGFQSAVGSNYTINNSSNPDVINWGTAATTFGRNVLSFDRVSSPFVLATTGTSVKVGTLSYTNTHTTGGAISAIDYNLRLDLPAFATYVDFKFTLTVNTTSDPANYLYSPLSPDSIKWTSSNETQVKNLGGENYVFAFSFADSTGSFLETENQFYAVDESYLKKTLVSSWGCDDYYTYTPILGTDSASVFVSVLKPTGAPTAPVPEPSTYGMLGAAALLAIVTLRSRSK